ncbi:DUF3304 domain-containing protein [Bordetella sp. LUAb4]|uniref:DUF3304 domain-containing protein n=1 Tax=Bordetella sp. LUAb4 TaxID=2843195 RepID=UPI001E5DBC84|nr:DUF3304 domain-containing protein [Bordetella sp. LUAb4]
MNPVLRRRALSCFLAATLLTLTGCWDPPEPKSYPADVGGYNYTDAYIDGFWITNEGEDFGAGGPNVFPKEPGFERSGGAKSMCCIGIPVRWRPGQKQIITWRRDTHPYDDDRSGDQTLTALAEVPPYGQKAYGFWVHFLPGDRIRIEIQDQPTMPVRPADDDPYIVQGVLDTQVIKK